MNQRDLVQALAAMEARLVVIERRLQELGDRSHDLADALSGIGLKTQFLWDERKKRQEKIDEARDR